MRRPQTRKGFRAALKHAFAIPREVPLEEHERRWLDRIARKVVQRGLSAPALLVLESMRPLNYVGSQALVFFKPIISLVFAPELCDKVARLLEKRAVAKNLAEMIERYEAEARAGNARGSTEQ